MRYLSLFSGIEAASVAWHGLGWECVGVSEIDPFASRVLAHHYRHVPNLGDVTKITEAQIAALGRIDALIFGSPCQDLSVAGKRKGLDGERSGLFFTAVRIIGWARKHCGLRWALWENVPGAFSSAGGYDFAAVVDALVGLECEPPKNGWANEGCALGSQGFLEWSTLDAQWFGVAQRRRRCFALADFGDWSSRPPILLEPQGLRGDIAPSREAGQGVAGTIEACTGRSRGAGTPTASLTVESRPVPVAFGGGDCSGGIDVSTTTTTKQRFDFDSETLVVTAFDTTQITSQTNRSNPQPGDACHPLARGAHAPCIAFPANLSGTQCASAEDVAPSMGAKNPLALLTPSQVRRLTPLECERLQGFPDHHTAIARAKDGPRYKALGNSMAVPVIRWIGQRIDFTHHWFNA